MLRDALHRLMPDASADAVELLDARRGALEAPIRSEIFGAARFQQHGRSLGEAHEARTATGFARRTAFFPRLRDNLRVLREAHHYMARQLDAGRHVSPAGEWLLDNFHIVEAQLKAIHEGLPRRYFRDLPLLIDQHLAGLPRIYGVAWAFVAHTDGAFDEDMLVNFLGSYQEARELTQGELWALPTTLRVVLVEDLRRLAERVACAKAAREMANLCCDRIDSLDLAQLQRLYAALANRGVGQAFALQMAQRLFDKRVPPLEPVHNWLAEVLPDPAAAQGVQQGEQAADNLSVSNVITSLRALGDADWRELIGKTSVLMRVLDGAGAFRAERDDTQDETLHAIERLARRTGRSEAEIGRTLVGLMQAQDGSADEARETPGYWLRGPGRGALRQALGASAGRTLWWAETRRRLVLPVYLSSIAAASVGLAAWMFAHHAQRDAPGGLLALAFVLLLLPAAEAVVAVVNRLISESVHPRRLPRLSLATGIPREHRVLVVIPAMLTSVAGARALAAQLERHHLANLERETQFALVTDWADAPQAQAPSDGLLLDAARQAIEQLNRVHAGGDDGTQPWPRFVLLHRERRWCETEQGWIGWERKRGKLEQLVEQLATGAGGAFLDLGELSRVAPNTPYIVTLDSDTTLPPGRLRELVGVAAHPHNQPPIDAAQRRVCAGWSILQPRIATPLPGPGESTPYHWLFAGQCGIDPYSAASSEVYQDLFDEGTFTGKGLLNVRALHALLAGRLPQNRVLSHDLLEGSIARCAGVSDITLVEDAPVHPDVAASRVHRWTRGDWQLLPLLLRARHYGIGAINRWKMLDNLRRSLVAPAALALLLLSLFDGVVSPWAALALVVAAFGAGPFLGAVAGLSPSRDELAATYFYRRACADVGRSLCSTAWNIALLLQQALLLGDAVLRALYRVAVSKRHLLQWTPAAAAQATASTRLSTLLRQHAAAALVGLVLLLALVLRPGTAPGLAAALFALWAATPLWVWWAARPRARAHEGEASREDRDYLAGVARDTWRLFERWVGAQDNHLPPDNVQTWPHTMVARRTSPTNIGLYLMSVACAQRFGWIGTQEMLARCEDTLATLAKLDRHRGHFLNWYDTQSLRTLPPAYVSAVDSGNLCSHLLALAEACDERAAQALPDDSLARAAADSRARLAPFLHSIHTLDATPALRDVAALDDPLGRMRADPAGVERLLQAAALELGTLLPTQAATIPGDTDEPAAAAPTLAALVLRLQDHLSTLRSLALDVRAAAEGPADTGPRLVALAQRCRQLAHEPEFGFLLHPKRRLLHIGYRVAEQQLDASLYDLLASESRFTSLWAIAKGDVPVTHWSTLGRPFYAVGLNAGLRSWSGSMFEYLMPTLVLDEPRGSVLHGAGLAAIAEQIAFGRDNDLPWGISECAYAASDHTLAYQYAPQGVPRLALRRTPPDERVIAPYATGLAVQLAPRAAADNYRRLEGLQARDAMGFIEALDFTPSRQSGDRAFTRVATFMAHHQGMTIVSIGNLLLDGAPRAWCMRNAHLQAVLPLLHERAPREISALLEPPPSPSGDAARRTPHTLSREVLPGATALSPTHLLSNGRYSVALRANGAGWSRFEQAFITRWRDDALRDAHGSFIYLRRAAGDAPVSLTQHPAPDTAAEYRSSFHADRVCLDATWPDLESRCTVWVSPEDDVELRSVQLRNRGDEAIELELLSCFEVSLNEARADEAHPAFTNLFVRAAWHAGERALYLERKPRLVTEQGLHAVHFIAGAPQLLGLAVQTDRASWLGRNHDPSQPLAGLAEAAAGDTAQQEQEQVTGLDPVAALSARLYLAPRTSVRLTFATAAASQPEALRQLVDKYKQRANVDRASLMSATLMGIRLRDMRINAEDFATLQTLSTTLALLVSRPAPGLAGLPVACDRRLLWRFGISGDRPILCVWAAAVQGVGLLRSLVQALRLWSWGGLPCDLVVVNTEPPSYLMPLQRELNLLQERYAAETDSSMPKARACGLHVLRAADLSAAENATLQVLARVDFQADGRPLAHHVGELLEWHDAALDEHQARPARAVPRLRAAARPVRSTQGRFDEHSAAFRFDVGAYQRPRKPWINVLANPSFGAQISEAGGGYSWGGNSRMNQLTPWSNDPVGDGAGETFLLHDLASGEVWNIAAGALGGHSDIYHVLHAPGVTSIVHRHGDLEVEASWCVEPQRNLKQLRLVFTNRGRRTQRLQLFALVEWMMGASRAERQSVVTGVQQLAVQAPQQGAVVATVLHATQLEGQFGFGQGTAFLAALDAPAGDAPALEWTCDRRELFDARGRLVLPDHLSEGSGAGLDPCAASLATLTVRAGATLEHVLLLGYADSPDAARQLAQEAVLQPAEQRLQNVRAHWDALLGNVAVRTPDPLFDALVNRWLLYQTVACRLWARAGFYQAGGAYGFRDQLQDAMSLALAAPEMLRRQILLNASRQFPEGDVQHWWHAPTGAGVRTHFSDDLLWLPHACAHYLQATGDAALLDEQVAFLDGPPIPPGAEDAYYAPGVSAEQASVYEHCARTIDKSLASGTHGLPLMGVGDWNDGMNRVGHEGRGESVWLAFFLCRVVSEFAPIARTRGDSARAQRWDDAAAGWRSALVENGWDGQWFKRAFFDDGTPLGSGANAECRIDLIAQAWSVLSGAVALPYQQAALAAAEEHLAEPGLGLIKLLDPPLQHALPSAGYIQAYPPGVRENGGQYSHAGVWLAMAHAQLGDGDAAYRCFTQLSPAHRAQNARQGAVYAIEPYVMAGDVYTQAPYAGRGGWSWYTGSAAWMHRAAIESICGLQVRGDRLSLRPRLPTHWPQVALSLRHGAATHEFIVCRVHAVQALAAARQRGAMPLAVGEALSLAALGNSDTLHLLVLSEADSPATQRETEGVL
jgi:cyclic beta-1,2-glucan synthetase